MSVVVQRDLDYFGDSGAEQGVVQILSPRRLETDYRCDYRIAWPGFDKTVGIVGIDEWQALHLAMRNVPSMICATDDFKEGRIGLWGETVTTYEEVCELFDVDPLRGLPQ